MPKKKIKNSLDMLVVGGNIWMNLEGLSLRHVFHIASVPKNLLISKIFKVWVMINHIGKLYFLFSDRPNVSLVHVWKSIKKRFSFAKKENLALSEHTCLTNHTTEWDKSKIITINRRYHQRLCLEAWHIDSAHAPLNRDDDGLLPDAYLHLVRKKEAN